MTTGLPPALAEDKHSWLLVQGEECLLLEPYQLPHTLTHNLLQSVVDSLTNITDTLTSITNTLTNITDTLTNITDTLINTTDSLIRLITG